MRKTLSFILCLVFMATLATPVLASIPGSLTWDGEPATLAEIARNTGYDLADGAGQYKPLYYYYASELWNNGLFLGSDGSFDLDNPLTRAEGVVMTIRILGKEAEAKATSGLVTFTDVPDWAKPYVAYAVQNGIANGYSTTTFGSADSMTAAQFITLSLRAMGYKDDVDFTWDKSYDKALEVGLIGQPCHTQYSRSNLFMRDNAAMIAYNAVFLAQTKAGGLLKNSIAMPGKPGGTVPTATRVSSPEELPVIEPDDERISELIAHVEAVMNLTAQFRAGQKPKGDAYRTINYNNNGTPASYWSISHFALFEYSQPRVASRLYSTFEDTQPSASELWDYRDQVSDGTYDFAGDPARMGVYYMDNGDPALLNLAAFQAAANNNAITQTMFDGIKARLGSGQGANAALLYSRNAGGAAYGCAVVLGLSGYSRDTHTGSVYVSLNPADGAFGQAATVLLDGHLK